MASNTRKKLIGIVALFLLVSTTALAAYKHDVLACALVAYTDFVPIDANVYVAPETTRAERNELLSLIKQAQARVVAAYGPQSATPVVIAGHHMLTLTKFTANEYATTHLPPGRSYIVIGPHGHNVDVIAHEFVHAEVFAHVGYWARTFEIPVWFDEGAAMQVDYRSRYDFLDTRRLTAITQLRYGWQFFDGDDDQLTQHYAGAKQEVRQWINKVGHKGVFKLLARVKNGESFDRVYAAMYTAD
ncbi:MAG: hypothetical protein HY308_11150 [Gammaproteobacteria bacterium]|nr:hypothetical protein [Gammaproteobacteria bacterium]